MSPKLINVILFNSYSRTTPVTFIPISTTGLLGCTVLYVYCYMQLDLYIFSPKYSFNSALYI